MDADAQAYFIQGFYFQNRESLGTGIVPIEGAVAVIREGTFSDMFAGTIWREPTSLGWRWTGEMTDKWGDSRLNSIQIDPRELQFNKKYNHRDDTICYRFERQDDMWVGRYSGDDVGEGDSLCVLNPVPEEMLARLQA